jgi:hypothetical protein
MKRRYTGACHCGFVRFEVMADIDHVRVCDCSICHKRGALTYRVDNNDLILITPLSHLHLYEWGSKTAKDYFCPKCGILPYRRPSAPTQKEQAQGAVGFDGWAINTRCLDGFDSDTVPHTAVKGSVI